MDFKVSQSLLHDESDDVVGVSHDWPDLIVADSLRHASRIVRQRVKESCPSLLGGQKGVKGPCLELTIRPKDGGEAITIYAIAGEARIEREKKESREGLSVDGFVVLTELRRLGFNLPPGEYRIRRCHHGRHQKASGGMMWLLELTDRTQGLMSFGSIDTLRSCAAAAKKRALGISHDSDDTLLWDER